MTRANLAVSPPPAEPQQAHAPTILLTPQPAHAPTILLEASPEVDSAASVANRLTAKGGILLNRFKLLEVIGEGGMSLVYKAIDLRKVEAGSADPHVAVKVLTVPFANYSDAMAVLSREAHNLQNLSHPNIVRVVDCDRDGEIVFMTMELLAGESLFERMRVSKGKPLPRDLAVRLIGSIANALDCAHGKNILHGDLKPGNVFITTAGDIKVIDFGLARLMVQPKGQAKAANNAADRMRALTPAYASPEMLGNEEPDPRDDVFSLACVAWKTMTGEHPFKGKDPAAARKSGAQLKRPAQLSRREFQALRHGLEFDRQKRTPTAHQFLAEFLTVRRGWSWRITAGIAASIIAVLAAVAFFAPKPVVETIRSPAVEPPVETAPAPPKPGLIFRDCPTCPLMKVMRPGEFLQGSAASDATALPFEMPQHKVAIAYSFAAGVYDVTVAEYEEFVAETKVEAHNCAVYDGEWRINPAVTWKNAVDSQTAAHPVSCVSWQDANDYAAWLSRRTHQTYRLPSASEWEYAARAGSSAQQPWSDGAAACAYANVADQTAAQRYLGWTVFPCADKFVQSAPVGSFAPNAFGLYDMLGNVFVWTDDCWSEDYQGAPVDGSARTDGDCTQHELRGGSWCTQPDYVRTSYRNRFDGDYRSTSIGFRALREISQ